jgi:uncharacterized protein (TIGR02594 family)
MTEPSWLTIARSDIGLAEVPGTSNAPAILRMWELLKAPFSDDATPWCGAAAGAWLTRAGYEPPVSCWRARNWLDWGRQINGPVLGCVAVFSRDAGGHVGLVVGQTPRGALAVLGGNQGDRVCIAAFPTSRVLGYRVPMGDRPYEPLPLLNADFSRSEA